METRKKIFKLAYGYLPNHNADIEYKYSTGKRSYG